MPKSLTEPYYLGSTCKTCFKDGLRGNEARIKYKSNKLCVRCRANINKKHYEKRTGEAL